MEQYAIEVTSNDPALLSYLSTRSEKSSWSVTEVEGTYYLISLAFQRLVTSEEIRQVADDLLFVLNGIMKLKFKHAHLIRGTKVAYFDNNGQLVSVAVAKTVTFRAHISVGESYFQSMDVSSLSSMDIWLKAQNDALVDEALRHYANEHNWFNLYKVFELIEHDVDLVSGPKVRQTILRIQPIMHVLAALLQGIPQQNFKRLLQNVHRCL